MSNIKTKLVYIKNHNPYLKLLWLKNLSRRGKRAKTISDIDWINADYLKIAGHYPNLVNPKTFSEKMQWLKLHYRNELMPILGDKFAARDYLEQNGYGYLLNELYAVYDNETQFNLDSLPKSFVLKAAHASSWNLIVKDKTKVDWWIWKKHIKYWLNNDIAWRAREWHYAQMPARIVCEKYLEDKSGGLMDYKFFCFNGVPKIIQANLDRFKKTPIQNYYNEKWEMLSFGMGKPYHPEVIIDKPHHFDQMLSIATELSKPFPFIRIDFYEDSTKIYFGEFTFFPFAGMPIFNPQEWDIKLGEWLELPDPNN